jgi:hypothetical protein
MQIFFRNCSVAHVSNLHCMFSTIDQVIVLRVFQQAWRECKMFYLCIFFNKHGNHIKNSLYLQPWKIIGSFIHVAHGILIMEVRSHVMNSLYLWLFCKEFCVKNSFSLWIFGKHGNVKGMQVRSYIRVLFWCVCACVF